MIILFDFIFTATGFKNCFFFLLGTYLKFSHPMSLIMRVFPHCIYSYLYAPISLYLALKLQMQRQRIGRKSMNLNNNRSTFLFRTSPKLVCQGNVLSHSQTFSLPFQHNSYFPLVSFFSYCLIWTWRNHNFCSWERENIRNFKLCIVTQL